MKYEEIQNAIKNYELTNEEKDYITKGIKLFWLNRAIHEKNVEQIAFEISDVINEICNLVEQDSNVIFMANDKIAKMWTNLRLDIFDSKLFFVNEYIKDNDTYCLKVANFVRTLNFVNSEIPRIRNAGGYQNPRYFSFVEDADIKN